jgi:hypothetical protein
MDERRKLLRKYLVVYSRVFDRNDGSIIGYLSDLSQEGAMIISDDPLPPNKLMQLRFDLPDPSAFDTDHLNVDVRVAWCSPDIDPSFWNIGFQFTNVDEKRAKIVEQMIEVYEFKREIPKYPPIPDFRDEF